MSAKELIIDFLNLIFVIVVIGFAIMYFIAGDNFENFKNLMQSLAPFGLFGLLLLIALRVNREKMKKRESEGNTDIDIHLNFLDKFKVELFVFSLPMVISAIAWAVGGKVGLSDFLSACVVFLLAYAFKIWLFAKEDI
ncbi:hypothetical protein GF382_00275 [Candidatus Falkowbacteria bacterium]|nr:hypothetical protein [Candidatus Falkowbacteria bacterium]